MLEEENNDEEEPLTLRRPEQVEMQIEPSSTFRAKNHLMKETKDDQHDILNEKGENKKEEGFESSEESELEDKNQQPKSRYVKIHMFNKEYLYNRVGFFLPYDNKFRYFIIWVNEWWHFDAFIIVCILVNSISLATYNYKNEDAQWNKNLDISGHVFSAIFIVEAMVKTIAQGFVFGRYAYLKDNWNVLDFIIVCAGILELLLQDLPINMKVIRTLRVLRPLKTINAVPDIRMQVGTLIQSLPHLATVALFLGFTFLMYGILGLQLFQGYIYGKCRLTEKPINATYWPYDPDFLRTCSPFGEGINECEGFATCGNPSQYGIGYENEYINNNGSVQYGISSFDNIFQAVLAVFQIITNDSWTTILFNLQDSTNSIISTFYSCSIVLICTFFSLNLVLAVIMGSFKKHQLEEIEKDVKEFEEREKEKKQLKLLSKQSKQSKASKDGGPQASSVESEESDNSLTNQEKIEEIMNMRANRRSRIVQIRQGATKKEAENILKKNVDQMKSLQQGVNAFNSQQLKEEEEKKEPEQQKYSFAMLKEHREKKKLERQQEEEKKKKEEEDKAKEPEQKYSFAMLKEHREKKKLERQKEEEEKKQKEIQSQVVTPKKEDEGPKKSGYSFAMLKEHREKKKLERQKVEEEKKKQEEQKKKENKQEPEKQKYSFAMLKEHREKKKLEKQKEEEEKKRREEEEKQEKPKNKFELLKQMRDKKKREEEAARKKAEEEKAKEEKPAINLAGGLLGGMKPTPNPEEKKNEEDIPQKKPISLGAGLFGGMAKKNEDKKEEGDGERKGGGAGAMLFKGMFGGGAGGGAGGGGDGGDDGGNPLVAKMKADMAKMMKIDKLEDRIKEREAMNQQTQSVLERIEIAMKKKLIAEQEQQYGFENEDKIMPVFLKKCNELLQNQKKEEEKRQEQFGTIVKRTNPQKKLRQLQVDAHQDLIKQFAQMKKDREQNEKEQEIRDKIQQSLGGFLKENLADKFKIIQLQEECMQQLQTDIFLSRAKTKKIYWISYKISASPIFEYFINLAIIANTVILSLDKYPETEQITKISEISNIVFYFIFLAEMLIKLVAYGFKGYFQDSFNCFDMFIVIVSTIDIGLNTFVLSGSGGGQGAVSAMRAFRLLRVFKLAKSWTTLHNLIKTVSKTLVSVSYFSVLLFLMIFVFTILGMDLFSYSAKFDENDELDLENGTYPNSTFNSFLDGFLSVFIVLANDGWSTIYFHFYRAVDPITATLFFVSLLFIGQYILLNLFLAILIDRFDDDSKNNVADQEEVKLKKQAKENIEGKSKALRLKEFFVKVFCQMICQKVKNDLKRKKTLTAKKVVKTDETIESEVFYNQIENNISLNYFKLDHPLRSKLRSFILPGSEELDDQIQRMRTRKMVLEKKKSSMNENEISPDQHLELEQLQTDNQDKEASSLKEKPATFEYIILVLIIISSVQLALENPLNDPDGDLTKVLFGMDIVLTTLFTCEAIAKIIAFGFVLNGKESYIRKTWNQIDFSIVLLSLVAIIFDLQISIFKVIRLFRVLRPLRVISRNEGLKISIQALLISIPDVFNVTMITVLFFVIFGIVGVNYLKGKYYRCEYQEFPELQVLNNLDCLNAGAFWKNFPANFDNVQTGMLTLFSMANVVGWAEIMYRGIDSRGPNLEPQRQSSPYISFFYIFFMIIGCFFMINLFVGVVISTYNRERESLGKLFLLTDDQKKWLEAKMLVVRAEPILAYIRPQDNRIRRFCYDLVMTTHFDVFIMTCIFLNTILLACNYYDQPQQFTYITETCNTIFLAVFTLEAILKLLAFKLRYFKDGWNSFDLLIVIGAYVGILISNYSKVQVGPASTTIRAFRIARIIKLFRRNRNLAVIFKTFMTTLPAMANVGGLLMLFVYIYAVLGVFLFSPIKFNGHLDVHVNFQNIGNAMLTLFRVSTGENWHLVLAALSAERTLDNQCIENASYGDYERNGKEPISCGENYIAITYFCSFILLVILIFLNLFIAIILSGFTDSSEDDSKVFNQDVKDHFKIIWSHYDPNATSFIHYEQLGPFLKELGKPLGIDQDLFEGKKNEERDYLNSLLRLMEAQNEEEEKQLGAAKKDTYQEEQRVNFLDVLECLSMQSILRDEFSKQIQSQEQQGMALLQNMMNTMKQAEGKKTILNHEIQVIKDKKNKEKKKKEEKFNRERQKTFASHASPDQKNLPKKSKTTNLSNKKKSELLMSDSERSDVSAGNKKTVNPNHIFLETDLSYENRLQNRLKSLRQPSCEALMTRSQADPRKPIFSFAIQDERTNRLVSEVDSFAQDVAFNLDLAGKNVLGNQLQNELRVRKPKDPEKGADTIYLETEQ